MPVSKDKTDILPGVLEGRSFKCNCTVALMTRLTAKQTGNAVWTSLKITSAEQSPPDGTYKLDVLGRVFKVQREDGKWPTLKL